MSSQRRIRPAPALPPDLLDWHQEAPQPPYTCPGRTQTDSAKDKVVVPESPLYRLLTALPIREATRPYWTLLLTRAGGRPQYKDLGELQQRLFKVLLPGLSGSEVVEAVTRLHGKTQPSHAISYWEMHRQLVSLADTWVPGFDLKDYVSFLTRLFFRITMRVTDSLSGTLDRFPPRLIAVFLRSPGNPLFSGWKEVRDGEAYSELYVYRSIEDAKGQKKRAKKLKTDLGPEDSAQSLEDDILYDEVTEETGQVCTYELLDLEDVVPMGEVAEAYLAHLKFRGGKNQERQEEEDRGRAKTTMESVRKRDSTPVGVYGQVLQSSFPNSPDSSFEEQESQFPEFEWEDDVQIGRGECSTGSAIVTEPVRQFLRDRLEKGAVILHKTMAVKVGPGYQASGTYFHSDRMYDLQITLLKTKKAQKRFQSPLEALRFLSLPRRRKEGENLFSLLLSLLSNKYAGKKPKVSLKNPPENRDDIGTVERFLGLSGPVAAMQGQTVDGYFDCVAAANEEAYKVLVVGKPRCGKSTVASLLCAQLHLRHIECGALLEAIVAKAAAPPDEDVDPDLPPVSRLSQVEQAALQQLSSGECLSDSLMIDLLRGEIALPSTQSTGFVLDLPWTNVSVMDILTQLATEFTHVLELWVDDSDLEIRVSDLKQDPNTGKVYSSEDVCQALNPAKPTNKVSDEDDEEDEGEADPAEEEEDPEATPAPTLNPGDMVCRPEDDLIVLSAQWNSYEVQVLPKVRSAFEALAEEAIVWVPVGGLKPEECVGIAKLTLTKEVKGAVRLNPAAEMRDLLLQDLKEGQEPRQVSPWRKYDPVALHDNQLAEGTADFSAEYHGRVFLFKSEENLVRFLAYPQSFLRRHPALPDFRVIIVGAEGVGKKTQAAMLREKYGWRVVDADEVLETALKTQTRGPERPSHPDSGFVQPSASEYSALMSGKALPSPSLYPLLLFHLGVPLQKKPPELPPEEEQQEEHLPTAEDQKEVDNSEAHSSEAMDEVGTQLGKREAGVAFSEAQTAADSGLPIYEDGKKEIVAEPIVYDDLPLAEIVRKLGKNEDLSPALGSFVMLGFPGSEEDIETMKSSKVDFHKVVYLTATEESLQPRATEDYSWPSKSLESADRIFSLLKDTFGDDKTVEISATGEIADVFQRIVLAIDPFADRIDSEDLITASEETPAGTGLTGIYDPVLMKTEGWLLPGNKEFKAYFRGREYVFNSQKEMEAFERAPGEYFNGVKGNWSPHVMVIGPRGAGVTTQADLLASELQLPVLDLRALVLSSLDQSARARRHLRYLLKGFRFPDDYQDSGVYVLPEDQDQDTAEEDPEFDRQAAEVQTIREVLGSGPAVIVGSWVDIGEKVATPLPELMYLAHRLPEVVVYLTIDDKPLVTRNIDLKAISDAHEAALAALKEEKAKRRAEALAAQDPDDPVEIPEEDDDESQLPSLAARIEEAKTALLTRKAEDLAALEELKAGFEDKGVKVDSINANEAVENVQKQIRFAMRLQIDNRENIVEGTLGKTVTKKKAEELLRDGKATLSEFGLCSPVTPYQYMREDSFPVLYRERIYYCRDSAEQSEFLSHISSYSHHSVSFPSSPALLPSIAIVGPPHSGISTLAESLSARFKLVKVRVKDAINSVIGTKSELSARLIGELTSGKPLSDEMIVESVLFRLRLADVRGAGYVLEGFPRNLNQAAGLLKAGIVLSPVIHVLGTQRAGRGKFKTKTEVVEERMESYKEVCGMTCWMETVWDSVHYLPPSKSKWFSLDFCSDSIHRVFSAKLTYLQHKSQPCSLLQVGFPRLVVSRNVGKWKRYDPVAWRLKGHLEYVDTDLWALRDGHKFVFFTSEQTQSAYLTNPSLFSQVQKPLPEARPQTLTLPECASVTPSELQLEGNCPVCLKHSIKCVPGSPGLLLAYDSRLFTFEDEQHVSLFMQTPWKYSSVRLPLKHVKKPSLLNQIADFEAGVAFLEQHLGVALMKSMMETAALRLCYPGLSVKETALKLLAICLKAGNPKNSDYAREKYTRKLKEFRKLCDTQVYFFEQANKRAENLSEKSWVDERFYRAADELQEVETGLIAEGPRFFNKYMR